MNTFLVWSAIIFVVLCSTGGDVLLSSAMKRVGIGAAFSDEDLELLRSLWLEEGCREVEAAQRSSRPKRPAQSHRVKAGSDTEISRFATAYRRAFGEVIAALTAANGVRVVELQSDGEGVDRTVDRLRALLALPRDERAALSNAARQAAVERWSWRSVANRLVEPLQIR